MIYYQIIVLVISLLVSYADRPKPPQPAKLSDFNFPQIVEGTPEQVVFGDCWISDWMILGYGNYRTAPVKAGGGK